MGWEQRSGRHYYYRKKREARRVRSEYVGTGFVAEICAANDEDERREQAAKRDADRQTRLAEVEIDRQLDDAESALACAIDSTLCAAGLHKHKGEWRKKRRERQTTAG